jgi:hypothetical protein
MLTSPRCERRLLFFLVTLLLISIGYGAKRTASATREDRVTIRPRRVVLVRTGEHARQFPERSRAIVVYPEVLGLKDSRVLMRVRSILQIKNVFGSSLAEYQDDGWLTDFSYKINHNRNYILDITFTQSGMAAYPDERSKHILINLKNGRLIKALDAFASNKFETLAAMVDRKLQQEIKQMEDENANDLDPQAKEWSKDAHESLKVEIQNLDDFSVGRKGITFLYDAGFPHAIKAFEPQGKYFFTYSELKPYIKRDGLLGQFAD